MCLGQVWSSAAKILSWDKDWALRSWKSFHHFCPSFAPPENKMCHQRKDKDYSFNFGPGVVKINKTCWVRENLAPCKAFLFLCVLINTFQNCFCPFIYLSATCCRNITLQTKARDETIHFTRLITPFYLSTLQSSKDLIRMNWIKWDLESFFSITIILFSWICIQNTTGVKTLWQCLETRLIGQGRGKVKELCFSDERVPVLQKDVYF